jgi:hypothetical protein
LVDDGQGVEVTSCGLRVGGYRLRSSRDIRLRMSENFVCGSQSEIKEWK